MTTTAYTTANAVSTFDEAIGFTVQQYLFAARMTRASLGEVLDVPGPSISNRLRGKIKWTGEDLVRTADAFGISIADLCPTRAANGSWVPAPYVPGQQKAPAPVGTGAPSLVAGTGFEPATSGL